jgi:hypothetical protein
MITIDTLYKIRNTQYFRGYEGVDGPTPIWLCESQISQIPCDYSDPNKLWLFPAVGHGTHVIIVYWKYMEGLSNIFTDKTKRSRHILENILYLNDTNSWCCRILRKHGVINIIEGDYLKLDTKMKFDIIIGNSPYQEKVGPKKTEPIWNKFFHKSISLLKYGGYLSLIHPSGWRNITGKFKDVQDVIRSKKVSFLSIHNEKDGMDTFGAETRYDYYVLQNVNNNGSETIVRFQDGQVKGLVLDSMDFIPNGGIDLLNRLIANDDEETVELIYSRSDYGTDKKHTSKQQSDEFIYPVVYTVNYLSQPTFYYSSTNQKGHYGKPKVIWSNGRISSIGNYVDSNGEYALTQFAYAIVDTVENLENIKSALDSKRFKNLMELCAVGQLTVNYKVVSRFKKDFWKEFINE